MTFMIQVDILTKLWNSIFVGDVYSNLADLVAVLPIGGTSNSTRGIIKKFTVISKA